MLVAKATQLNQALVTKAKTPTKGTGTKPNKVEKTYPENNKQMVIKQKA